MVVKNGKCGGYILIAVIILDLRSCSSCNEVKLERRLIGEGSHRRLCTTVRLDLMGDCEIILTEKLPSGVFADPFELQHLVGRGVFKDASVFGDTNLEMPSFLSNQSTVEVHLDAVLELKIEIPLHARYPPLDESGYSNVTFRAPDLFMCCKLLGQSCSLLPIATGAALELDDVVWTIPAGIKAHSATVSAVTFTSALLSAAFIVIASLQSSRQPFVY